MTESTNPVQRSLNEGLSRFYEGLKELGARGIQAEVFRPIAGACSLVMC